MSFTSEGSDASYQAHREGLKVLVYKYQLPEHPRTQNPEPRTQNPEPRTQNPESKIQNPKPKTQSAEPRAHQNPEHIRIKNSELRMQSPESKAQETECNFHTLFQELLSNLRVILSCPIPPTAYNYSQTLRLRENDVLEITGKLLLDTYEKKREAMSIVNEVSDEVVAGKTQAGEPPSTFDDCLKQLNLLARELDSYKHAWADLVQGPRDFKADRQKWEELFEKIEGAEGAEF